MRRLGLVCSLLVLAAAVAACDDDDNEETTDSALFPMIDAGPRADASKIDSGGGGQIDSGGGAAAPVISAVDVAPSGACTAGTPSNYTVTTTVTDQDTSAANLTFSGSATSCTGTITGATATLNCPNLAGYPGSVTVTDPEGNSDSMNFFIPICMSSHAP